MRTADEETADEPRAGLARWWRIWWVKLATVVAVPLAVIGAIGDIAVFPDALRRVAGWAPGRSKSAAEAPRAAALERGACGSLPNRESATSVWFPERRMFTINEPAPFPTLNAIRDNPNEGDERAWFTVKSSQRLDAGGFCSSGRVGDGDILLFRSYVENSAADNLAEPDGQGEGVARDVRLHIQVDQEVASLRRVTGHISASNTEPKAIGSVVELSSDQPFRLDVVSGSARLYSNAAPQGVSLSDDLWRTGVHLGQNGSLVPGYQHAQIITFQARVTFVA
jgi:hypothetical protein